MWEPAPSVIIHVHANFQVSRFKGFPCIIFGLTCPQEVVSLANLNVLFFLVCFFFFGGGGGGLKTILSVGCVYSEEWISFGRVGDK